ncbi:MAG: hypothetical protein ABSB09_14720 [Acidimicrobiales bacterium]
MASPESEHAVISPDVVVEDVAPLTLDDFLDAVGIVGTPDRTGGTPAGLSASPSGRPSRRFLQAAVLALPVLFLAVVAWTHRSMFSDGFIYLHVVQNILAGHGPVFNEGQRVEAFTSPLWTLVLSAAGFATPFPLDSIAVDLGILFTVSGTAIAVVSSAKLVRSASPGAFLLPLGAVVFVAISPVWSLASLGLETGLTFFWLGCCLALLVRWAGPTDREVPRYGLVVLGLGPLVRPELGLDSLVFVGLLLCVHSGPRTLRRQVAILAWAGGLPFAYQVFRMGYFGMIVANTAVAKEASMPRLGRGIEYFADFVGPYWMFVPAVALLAGAFLPLASTFHGRAGARRSLYALAALPVAGALNAAYITVMGGDYVHARLLVAPLFAVCAPVAAVPLARKYLVSLVVIPWALVCATTLRSPDASPWATGPIILVTGHGSVGPSHPDAITAKELSAMVAEGGTYIQFNQTAAPVRLDGASNSPTGGPVLATSFIGSEPYELGPNVQILDLLGLADALTAHLQLEHRGEFTGHEKPLPTPWIMALLTPDGASTAQMAALQSGRSSLFTRLIPDVTGRQLDIETAWARAALTCPTIHTIEYGTSRPLTVGVFVSDIVHAVSATTVRIPADPETAYHRFCGPGTPSPVRELGG